jgi:hypothetical protein
MIPSGSSHRIRDDANQLRSVLQKHFIPFAVIAGGHLESELLLLKGRLPKKSETLIYVCVNHTCQLPVTDIDEVLTQLGSIKM